MSQNMYILSLGLLNNNCIELSLTVFFFLLPFSKVGHSYWLDIEVNFYSTLEPKTILKRTIEIVIMENFIISSNKVTIRIV